MAHLQEAIIKAKIRINYLHIYILAGEAGHTVTQRYLVCIAKDANHVFSHSARSVSSHDMYQSVLTIPDNYYAVLRELV